MGDTGDQKPRFLTAQQPGSIKGVRYNGPENGCSCGFHAAFTKLLRESVLKNTTC